jgi:hypothetical protein
MIATRVPAAVPLKQRKAEENTVVIWRDFLKIASFRGE